MKKFLLVLLFLVPTHLWATCTLVAHDAKSSTDGANVTTAGVTTTGANLLITAVAQLTGHNCTFSDSNSNTWTTLNTYDTSSESKITLRYVFNPTVGASHTITCNEGSSFPGVALIALSGIASSPFDVQNGAFTNSATSVATGSITPGQDNECIISAGSVDSTTSATLSVDSGMTLTDDAFSSGGLGYEIAMAYKIQTTATAINPTWTTSSVHIHLPVDIASFKATAVAGGPAIGSLTSTGVGK